MACMRSVSRNCTIPDDHRCSFYIRLTATVGDHRLDLLHFNFPRLFLAFENSCTQRWTIAV
jgi:hypothetical protein